MNCMLHRPERYLLHHLGGATVWRKGEEMSDHFWVEAHRKLVGGWRSAGRMEGVRNMLKVSELNNSEKEGHTTKACVENMKCVEVGRSRVWRRSRKSSEI